jgi:hypothetical protein
MDKLSKIIRENILSELGDGPKFKPTVQWISENYAKANKELFDGELGDCIFKAEPIKSNSNWLGSFGMNPHGVGLKLYADRLSRRLFVQDSWGNKDYVNKENFYDLCKPTITLSTYYSGTQESLYATLVHEMCHYYTYMKGYAPKQAHGPEFRQIGNYAAYKSNGQLTVQRIASAEQMEGYDVDDEIKQRRERRAAVKKVNAHYYLIVWKSGRVGIINPTDSCLRDVISYEQRSDSKVKEILDITDQAITNEIYEKYGFTKKMRTYRFWAEKAGITQSSEIVKRIMNNSNTHKIILENE